MAPTLRKRSNNSVKCLVKTNTSDSDDYSPIHKKQQLERSKSVQKKVSTIYDFEESSDSIIQSIEIKDKNSRHINVTAKNTNARSIDNIDYQNRKHVLSQFDNSNVQISVKNRRVHRKSKTLLDDSSSGSDTSSRQIKRKRIKPLNDNKKTNNKVEPLVQCQTIENQHKEDCCSNLNLPGPSTFINQNELTNKGKEETIYNSKTFVMASMEELMRTFSKFEQQIKRFLSMFAKNDFMTPQDAEDAMFVSNCIVDKAKEELTERQQELMTYYPQLYIKHKCECIVQPKQCVSTNNLQAHNEICSRYGTTSKTVSPNLKEHSVEGTKNLRKSDEKHNKCIMQQQETIINNDSVQMQNVSCSNSGTNIVSLNLKEQPGIENSKKESNKNNKDMQQESVKNTKDVQSKQCVKNNNGQGQNEENSSSTTDVCMLNFKKQPATMTNNSTNNFYKNNEGSKQYKQHINSSNLKVQNVLVSDSDNEIFSPNFKLQTLALIENSKKNNEDVRHQEAIKKDSNAKSKQCASYENLQAQNDMCSQSSNDTVIIQRNSEEQSLKVTKDLKDAHQQGARNGRVEALLGRVDNSAFEIMNDTVASENNRITSPSLVDESQLLNSCLEDSEANDENITPTKKVLVNCDSDVSSTCSTVTFYPVKYKNIQNVDDCESCAVDETQNINTDELEDRALHTLRNSKTNKVPVQKIRRINSDETIIIAHNKRSNFNKQQLENKVYNNLPEPSDTSRSSSSEENIFPVRKSNSNIFNMNNLERKNQSKLNSSAYQGRCCISRSTSENKNEVVDKKLGTKCQVVIEKFKFG